MEPEVADKYNIKTYTDLTKYSREFVFSPTLAFENRADGLPGLQKNYDLEFKKIKSMDGALRYQALKREMLKLLMHIQQMVFLKKLI